MHCGRHFGSGDQADAFLRCDAIDGTLAGPDGTCGWFVADSFSFGVERELKKNLEKGGTEDINIGVGELQECTISKSMDAATANLAQFAINGNSLGNCSVCLTNGLDRDGSPACYLHYKLARAFVKSWNTSGDADDRPTEEVAFYYNKIAFAYMTDDGDGNRDLQAGGIIVGHQAPGLVDGWSSASEA